MTEKIVENNKNGIAVRLHDSQDEEAEALAVSTGPSITSPCWDLPQYTAEDPDLQTLAGKMLPPVAQQIHMALAHEGKANKDGKATRQ